jgi:hypothetical protein
MGERENFPNQPELQCKISFQMSMQTITYQMKILYVCLFQILQQSLKFDFQCFLKRQKQFFERKTLCSLFKKNPHYTNERAENQINEQANNPIYSFNESKNKEQTK